jgi:hypothetical protein
MVGRILLGTFLLVIAALDVWAARDVAALRANPGAAWLVRMIGPSRTRSFLFGVAAFLTLLGLATIGLAVTGGQILESLTKRGQALRKAWKPVPFL